MLVRTPLFSYEIVRSDDPIEVSERFDFTYKISNNRRIGGSTYIDYWLEAGGKKFVSGSETIYLLPSEEKEINANLLLLEGMVGEYQFHLRLKNEGQSDVVISKTITIQVGAPTKIELSLSSLKSVIESLPLSFKIEIGSNRDKTVLVLVEEKIYKNGKRNYP